MALAALLLTHCASIAGHPALDPAVATALGTPGIKYVSALVDLDGNARPDAVVLVQDSDWCGTGGCNLLVSQRTAAGFSLPG